MLGEYAKSPKENWKHKDAAIYLVTSLASKAQTQKVVCPRDADVSSVTTLQHFLNVFADSTE